MTGSIPAKFKKCIILASTYLPISIQLMVCCNIMEQNQPKIIFKTINLFQIQYKLCQFCHFCTFPYQSIICVFFMHINRVLIKAQESSPEAFKICKIPELLGLCPGPLLGRCPWIPPEALRRAPGPHPWWLARYCGFDLGLSGSINFFDRHSFKNDGQLLNPSS